MKRSSRSQPLYRVQCAPETAPAIPLTHPVYEDRVYITVQSRHGSAEETEAAIAALIEDAKGLTIDAIAVFRVPQ